MAEGNFGGHNYSSISNSNTLPHDGRVFSWWNVSQSTGHGFDSQLRVQLRNNAGHIVHITKQNNLLAVLNELRFYIPLDTK